MIVEADGIAVLDDGDIPVPIGTVLARGTDDPREGFFVFRRASCRTNGRARGINIRGPLLGGAVSFGIPDEILVGGGVKPALDSEALGKRRTVPVKK
ncbi:MAG: hypothetical protein J6V07_06050 [Clostridia bacterium]|nr:hypothetical protein [Clostridia bacterium]